MPRPAEIEVEEWAAPKGSYSLSRALGEAGEPAFLAQRADAVAPAGQDLVRIALVADVEDQPVVRRVEDLVDGDRQFDDAEARAEMAAGPRHGVDHLRAHFGGQLRQASVVQPRRSAGQWMVSRSGVFGGCVTNCLVSRPLDAGAAVYIFNRKRLEVRFGQVCGIDCNAP